MAEVARALGKLPEAAPSSAKGVWTMTKLAAAYTLGLGLIKTSGAAMVPGTLIATAALSGFFVVGVDCSRRSFFPYKALNDFVGFLVLLPLLRSASSIRDSPKGGSNLLARTALAAQHSGLALIVVSAAVSAAIYSGKQMELLKYWVIPLLCMHLQLGTFTASGPRAAYTSYLLLHPDMQAHAATDASLAKAAGATPAYAVKSLHVAASSVLTPGASLAGIWAGLVRFVIVSGKRELVLWPLGAALGVLASPWAREALALDASARQLTMQSTTDWMAAHYEVPFTLVALYLTSIFVGTKLMESREPFDLKAPLALWNALLAAGSMVGFVAAGSLAVQAVRARGPHVVACDNSIWWGNPAVMLFCLSKVPELLDTAFIVLRKKPLHFLHYYHHATVLLFCWDAWVVNNAVGGMFAIMNLFVHSVMYAYYCAAALGIRFPQFLRKNITNLQLSQMVLGCGLCVYNMCTCNRTPQNNKYGLAMYASYFALFLNFWVQQYVLAPKGANVLAPKGAKKEKDEAVAKPAAAAKAPAKSEAKTSTHSAEPITTKRLSAAKIAERVAAEVATSSAAEVRKTAITYPDMKSGAHGTPEELVNEGGSEYFLSALNYPMGAYITLVHLLALWGAAYVPFLSWKTLLWSAILWPITGFGITGGAHRLWSHKAYKAKLPFRFGTMIANSIANQGTIFHWARDHRTHHLYTEQDADPHNALRGFTFAHIGWLYLKKRQAVITAGKDVDMSDILADPVCEIQRKCDPWWNMFWCFIFPALVAKLGWGEHFGVGVLVPGFLRYTAVLHFTWLVNSAAHLFGDRPYDVLSNPAENLTVAIASLGEGWHNWHHKYAFDYAASEYGVGLQFNPTKLIIDIGWLFGQTYDHKRATGVWEREVVRKDAKEAETLKLTLAKDSEELTLRSIKAAIPKECFEHSYVHSFLALGEDIAYMSAAVGAVLWCQANLPAWAMLVAWPTYWFYQGIFGTGVWVLAHECGHGGFTASQTVNDVTGFLLHSFLLTPYFSWQITHAKHHKRTNHLTDGESWVPSAGNADGKKAKWFKSHQGTIFRIALVWTIGWWVYLLNNDTGARKNKGQSHFDPNARGLFSAKEAWKVRASNAGMVAMTAVLAYWCQLFGVKQIALLYLAPQMIVNIYLTCITFMQHTHEEVPHFAADEWTWLRGGLSTIDRSFGVWYDRRLHHITDSHVCHHLFSDMPFYGAKKATPYIKEHCGNYYRSHISTAAGSVYLGFWRDFYVTMKKCLVVGESGVDHFWYYK